MIDKSIIFAFISSIIWGMSFLATKIAVIEIPPITLGFLRFLIAYITLLFITKLLKIEEKIEKKHIFFIVMMGFTGVTLSFVFENYGLQYTSASNASLIISTVPIFTLIFNAFVLKEKISKMIVFGIILSFIGIYFLLFGFSLKMNFNFKGDIIMFFASFSWVAYTYFTKTKMHYSVLTITKYLSLYGLILFIPFMIIEWIVSKGITIQMSGIGLISLLYLGIICSALAYLLWNTALRDGDSKRVNSFIYLIPIFSIIAESLYYKKMPSLNIFISSFLIISGLFIAHIKVKNYY